MSSYRAACPNCDVKCSIDEEVCPQCGWILLSTNPRSQSPQTIPTNRPATSNERTKYLLGIAGSLVLFVGVFTPIVSMPVVGNVNYFQNGEGDGVIVLILALISLVLTLTRMYKGLWITGLLSLGIMVFTFVNFRIRMSELEANMQRDLAGNPFKGLADLAMHSVQLQWGWAVLIVGAALLVASAAMRQEQA